MTLFEEINTSNTGLLATDYNQRRELFKKYYAWSVKFNDCDPALFLANYINKRMELNIEQRYWMAWLYGNTYNLPTAWIIANEFPDYENVNLITLTKWNNENYKRLRYQTDNKWQKGHLPKMFESYKHCIGDNTQKTFFESLLLNSPEESFNNIYNYIVNNFFKFGRYLTWFYLQTLKETCDLNIAPPTLLLNEESSRSHCKGLMYALGVEEWGVDKKFKLNKEQLEFLNKEAAKILQEIQQEYPDLEFDYFSMETILCAFKKIFRHEHGRYLGYYLDRQAEDIIKCQNDGWYGIEWNLLWQGRDENIRKDLLHNYVDKTKFGELLKYNKIDKLDEI